MKNLIILISLIICNKSICQNHSITPKHATIKKELKNAIEILQNDFHDTLWQYSEKQTNPWKHKNIWNAYNTFEVLVDYSIATGDSTYLDVIKNFAKNKSAFDNAINAGYDDAQWTGIAFIKVYHLTKEITYLNKAIYIWNYLVKNSWDNSSCAGGFWWNIEKTYKNAITNELFITFSTMLYFETQENKYNQWAIKTWNWFKITEMLSKENGKTVIKDLVNDGVGTDCKSNKGAIWTYNQALLIGGLTNLWLINEDKQYLEIAKKITDASIDYFADDGILIEKPFPQKAYNSLNTDQQQFKGIFMRYLSYFINALKRNHINTVKYEDFILSNYKFLLGLYPNKKFGTRWHNNLLKNYNAISQTSGIDLILAQLRILK